MRFKRLVLILSFIAALGCYKVERTTEGTVETFFSAVDGIEWVVEQEIDQSERSIDVAVYNFTSRPLAQALVDAHQRGVDVRVIMDPTNASSRYSKAPYLKGNGIEVRTEKGAGLMHHKFALIDDTVLITGSFNWTASAEADHDENILLLKGYELTCSRYQNEFDRIWRDARIWQEEKKDTIRIRVLDYAEMRNNVGEQVLISGLVTRVGHSERSNTYFLNFSPEEVFTVVIFSSAVSKFDRLDISIEEYEGSEIEVMGELIDHPDYGLEIIVEEPSQIRHIE